MYRPPSSKAGILKSLALWVSGFFFARVPVLAGLATKVCPQAGRRIPPISVMQPCRRPGAPGRSAWVCVCWAISSAQGTAMEKGNGLVRVRSSASGRLIMVRVIAPGAVEPVLDAAPAGDGPADDVTCSRTH
ncbi:hypothetical protein [Dyella sp.]|uniref:hypothetical protein n=1 Tax=Dyella sp. TaxID=1869338 RepID=UPI0032163BA4